MISRHKDRLFKFIFGNPDKKEWTLSLYNAVNGSHYTNPEDIEFNTIEDAVYMGMKNDVSFIIMDDVSLWEHQSSYNPNMPVRFFIYAGQLYDKYMTANNIYRYGTRLHRLPKPKCICFYNGTDEQPEEKILRLSEAFGDNDGDIEVRVRMLNINYGRNKALMYICEPLNEYAWFVEAVRKHEKKLHDLELAVDAAIDEMPDSFGIKKFLLSNKAEVKGMYLTEYDAEKERKLAREEAHEVGRAEGLALGRAEGRAEGLAEEKHHVVSAMLQKNFPLSLIEEISRLSRDAILKIADNIGVSVMP